MSEFTLEQLLAERKRRKRVAAVAKWQRANPVKRKAASDAYYAANRGKVRAQVAAYRRAHPEVDVVRDLKQKNGITDPPEELVEAIVTIRRLKRLIKEKQDA